MSMLYVGVTCNLNHRVAQHKKKLIPGLAPIAIYSNWSILRNLETSEKPSLEKKK
jgi:predicted GIY-YIG superfamily endonuclease